MLRADVIYLIDETPGTHGYFDKPTYRERMVYCTVRSVGMNEYYRAHEQGLNPEIVFELADCSDYNGERLIRWGERAATTFEPEDIRYYRVIRTYVDGLKIELTCEEAGYVTTDA